MSETSTLKNSHGTWCIVTLKFTRSTSSRNSSTTSVVADLSAKYSESSKRKSVIITMVPMSEMIMPGVLLMTRSSGTCLKKLKKTLEEGMRKATGAAMASRVAMQILRHKAPRHQKCVPEGLQPHVRG